MTRKILAILAAACSSPPRRLEPPTSAPASSAPASSAAGVAARPDALPALKAIARQRADELGAQAEPEGLLAAFGACTRPTDERKTAILAQINKWIGAKYKGSVQGGAAYGCEDANGIVVTAQLDREQPREGRWWIWRVTPARVDLVEEVKGPARGDFMESVQEQGLYVLALADLDGDGKLDVIAVDEEHEGGAEVSSYHLHAILTTTGKTSVVGDLHGTVGLAPGGDRPVLSIDDSKGEEPPAFACIEATGIADCPAATAARRRDELGTLTAAIQQATALPDREELANDLELLGVPESDRPALLAAAPPTEPAVHLDRQLVAFRAAQTPGPSKRLRMAGEAMEEQARLRALDDVFGAEPCKPGAKPAAAQIQKLLPPKAHVRSVDSVCRAGANEVLTADWELRAGEGDHETIGARGVFFVQGGAATLLVEVDSGRNPNVDEVSSATESPFYPRLQSSAYLHGASIVTFAFDTTDAPVVRAFVDGKDVGRADGRHGNYPGLASVIVTLSDPRIFRAVNDGKLVQVASFAPVKLDLPAGDDPVTKIVGPVEQRASARELLGSYDPARFGDPDVRADLRRALVILGGDPKIVP